MNVSAQFLNDVALVRNYLSNPSAKPAHGLSSTKVVATVDPAGIDYGRLRAFASRGNLVEVEVKSGNDYRVRFRADAIATFAAGDPSGELGAVATDQENAEAAIESGRFLDLATAIVNPTITLELTIRAPANRVAFVWAADALLGMVDSWIGLAQLLAKNPHLLVLDAGASSLTTETLTIRGPDAPAPHSQPTTTTWSRDGWHLASPTHYLPSASTRLPRLSEALYKLAAGVVWLRISTSAPATTPGANLGMVEIALSNDPSSHLAVDWSSLPATRAEATRAAELWDWLDHDDQTARLEAARQAAAAAVHSPTDLRDAAAPVLRQARFLHDLSRRQAVAAIVDARKAAWAASQTASHTAAAEARASARSTADRTVAAVIAALAVMITHQTEVLSRSVSYLVLAAVFVGVGAALLHAYRFEFPATEAALNASLDELSTTQRHILLSEDVREIVNGPVVSDARGTLKSARRASGLALGVAMASVVAGVCVVAIVEPKEAEAPPGLSSTTAATTPFTAPPTTAQPPPSSVTPTPPPTTNPVAPTNSP